MDHRDYDHRRMRGGIRFGNLKSPGYARRRCHRRHPGEEHNREATPVEPWPIVGDYREPPIVNALVARQAIRAAEDSLVLLDKLIHAHSAAVAPIDEAEQEEIDDLTVERGVAETAVQDTYEHYTKARHQLGHLLEIEPEAVDTMKLRSKINILCPTLPGLDVLVATAKEHRPDLIAHRIGVTRARAKWSEEKSVRLSDA